MPLMSAGTTIFLVLEWNVPGAWTKARQNLTSFISLAAYLRYQASSAARAALGARHQERQFAGGDDREAAGLIAGIDVSEVGDAVARHVVMVERLAELLRGIDFVVHACRRTPSRPRRPSPPAPSAADATAGTQCEILRSKVFSCALALLAQPTAKARLKAAAVIHPAKRVCIEFLPRLMLVPTPTFFIIQPHVGGVVKYIV